MLVVSSALCQKNFNLSYLVLLFVMIAGYQGFNLTFEPLFYLNKRIDSFIQKIFYMERNEKQFRAKIASLVKAAKKFKSRSCYNC